jgi:hypothetical protein
LGGGYQSNRAIILRNDIHENAYFKEQCELLLKHVRK